MIKQDHNNIKFGPTNELYDLFQRVYDEYIPNEYFYFLF